MKLKNRIVTAFLTIIILPGALSFLATVGFGKYTMHHIEKTYGVKGDYRTLTNPVQMLNKVTEISYEQLKKAVKRNPDSLRDARVLNRINRDLMEKNSYLLVRQGGTITYLGKEDQKTRRIIKELPAYDAGRDEIGNSVYLGGRLQTLLKQVDFKDAEGGFCSAFIVTDVAEAIPEGRHFVRETLFCTLIILVMTAVCLAIWVYKGVLEPVEEMQKAAERIRNGDLNFRIVPMADDELGHLAEDLESMRQHLKETMEEKIKFDADSRELVSNISHDLKTPITTIKGYAEGIMDGVATTPEKQQKYLKTIYHKANEMEKLINELSLYTKIDSNKIPYNFQRLPVNAYFKDCAEEFAMDLSAREIAFAFYDYVPSGTEIVADPEQIARVMNNLFGNAIKYMDKDQPAVNMRLKDLGEYIQVEVEDNGTGIGAKELPYIFDRFYRSDASRNSEKGGSGIGLSIVKKIISEHGGRIWATSREGTGTTMYFVLKKFEPPIREEGG